MEKIVNILTPGLYLVGAGKAAASLKLATRQKFLSARAQDDFFVVFFGILLSINSCFSSSNFLIDLTERKCAPGPGVGYFLLVFFLMI
jgi:hypothetical protein